MPVTGDTKLFGIRRGLTSDMSRAVRNVERLTRTKDLKQLPPAIQALEDWMNKLEAAHDDYMKSINLEEADQKDIDIDEKVIERWQIAFNTAVEKAHVVIDVGVKPINLVPDATVQTASGTVNVSDVGRSISRAMSIPQRGLADYDGDALGFYRFFSLFENNIANKLDDDKSKILQLISYLSGDALEEVDHVCLNPDAYTYEKVKQALKSKFAKKEMIGESLQYAAQTGPKVKSAVEFAKFSREMTKLHTSLKDLEYFGQINTLRFVNNIMLRLQLREREKWKEYAFRYKDEHGGTNPDFEVFVKYVSRKSDRYNDPVLGSDADKRALDCISVQAKVNHLQTGHPLQQKKGGGAQGAASDCVVCSEKHENASCPKLQKMDLKDIQEVVRKNYLCYRCLKKGHRFYACKSMSTCGKEGCNMKHHTLVHDDDKVLVYKASANQLEAKILYTISAECNVVTRPVSTKPLMVANILLPIVKLLINDYETYGLLDDGSTNSLMSSSLCRRLGLTGVSARVALSVIGSTTSRMTKLVEFDVKGIDESMSYHMSSVIVVPEIPACNNATRAELAKYAHLVDIPTHGVEPHRIEVLIGQDHSFLLIPDEVREGNPGEPHATHTRLGWAIQGPVNNVGAPKVITVNLVRSVPPLDVVKDITKLWSHEKEDETVLAWSRQDKQVHEMWENTCKVDQHGQYVLPIPFRDERPAFPNNKVFARARLTQNVNKMKKNGTYDSYDAEIRKIISDGYAELVPDVMATRDDGMVWYLPHFAVYRDDKPGKTRVVMDAKAMYKGVSLNSECLSGPDLNNKLTDVLVRFRQFESAVTGDIQAMYHRVVIPEDERDVLRFLWCDESGSVQEYRWTCHIFGGIWCASSSTFALRRAVEEADTSDKVRQAINKDTYVDDCINSTRGAEVAAQLAKDVSEALLPRGFKMIKFIGHPKCVTKYIPEELCAKDIKTIETDPEYSALGMKWDTNTDVLFYRKKPKPLEGILTKRKMLSHVASVFDPLGLIAPIIIAGRLLFQRATKLKVGWDEALPEGLTKEWTRWWLSLDDLEQITFPRCLLGELYDVTSCDVHHFCDASQIAWGSAAYVRIQGPGGKVHTCLIKAKGRVAPVKQITIPRLELCAAVTAVHMDIELRREMTLEILTSTFWSDSEIVLKYIRNETLRLKLYVANRITFISNNTDLVQWRHVPTLVNVGDIVSRGSTVMDLPDTWKSGPEFLRRPSEEWPVEGNLEVNEDELEVKGPEVYMNVISSDFKQDPLDRLLEFYYQDYDKLKRSMAWFNRFIHRGKQKSSNKEYVMDGVLTTGEIQAAEISLIKDVQGRVFSHELACLKAGKGVSSSSSLLKLAPMLQGGLIVVGGRLGLSDLPEGQKHPIILPKKHLLSVAVLTHVHRRAHLGSEWVLTQVKEKFHIPGARTLLSKIRKECVRCNRYFSAPQHQLMAELPKERLTPGPYAFSHAAVDLFGNFFVKVGRARHKRYGVVFTCMASRAVHIEIAHSLEAESFIMAFKRFAARRGTPKTCKSDRGTNIVGATEEMRKAWLEVDTQKIEDSMKRMNVEWVFNTPKNSEAGGVWERMIRSIRKTILGILNPSVSLTDEILMTVMTEAENLINSRPITRVSEEPTSGALTPNHILIMQGNSPHSLQGYDAGMMVRSKWKQISQLLDSFWARWSTEYLHTLQQRQKWHKDLPNMKVGDVVVIMEANTARGYWPTAIVTGVKPGTDGRVRSVTVKTANSFYDRPVGKLVKLELESQDWLKKSGE